MQVKDIELWQGDCLEEMKKIPDKSVDCIICDLPYFRVVKDDFDNQWKSEQDYLEFIESVILEYKRVLNPNGNVFLFTSRQLNRKICYILDKFF